MIAETSAVISSCAKGTMSPTSVVAAGATEDEVVDVGSVVRVASSPATDPTGVETADDDRRGGVATNPATGEVRDVASPSRVRVVPADPMPGDGRGGDDRDAGRSARRGRHRSRGPSNSTPATSVAGVLATIPTTDEVLDVGGDEPLLAS